MTCETKVVIVEGTRDDMAKLGELLLRAFQEDNYFDMDDKPQQFVFEVDDNPAIYAQDGSGECICFNVAFCIEE